MATTQLKQRLLSLANTFVDIVEDMEKEEQKTKTPSLNVKIEYKLPGTSKPIFWNANTEDVSVAGVNAATEIVMQATLKNFDAAGVLIPGKTPAVLLTISDQNDKVLYRRVKTVVPKVKWNFHENDLKLYSDSVANLFDTDGEEDAE